MTKNTDTISTQKAASAGGKAALSGADILQAAQYDANDKAGLPTLRSAFPQYRELTEVLQEIAASPEMTGAFRSLTPSAGRSFWISAAATGACASSMIPISNMCLTRMWRPRLFPA